MVPTNEPMCGSGGLLKGGTSHTSLAQPAGLGSMPRARWVGGRIEQTRCWVLEPQRWFHQAPTQPRGSSSAGAGWGGVW